MAREIVEPTAALDALVEQAIRPLQAVLLGIISELVGPGVPEQKIRLCSISVIGQCIHWFLARPVLRRLHPQLDYSAKDIEMVAEHVTQFSLAALHNLPREGQTS